MSTPATSSEPSSSPATPAPASSADDRVRNRNVLARYLSRPEIGALFGVLAIAVFFLLVAEPFRHMANTGTILYQSATIGIMAVPVALLMVAGEFDLSAGVAVTTAGLSASLLAWYFNFHVWAAVGLSLLIALAIGALNGFMLNRSGLPSFLITLATFFVLQGVNLGVTRSVTGGVASNDISDMAGFDSAHAFFAASMKIGPVNLKIPVLFWIILTIIAAFVLLRTKVGNWIFAIGDDEKAARAVGVPVWKVRVGLYMFVGFCAWLSGMHLLFAFNQVQSGEGIGNEFIYIIAAVVGGCLLTGGYGSVVGAALGALIFGMTRMGINYAGWNVDWFFTFLGVMLLLATLVNLYVKKKADAR